MNNYMLRIKGKFAYFFDVIIQINDTKALKAK